MAQVHLKSGCLGGKATTHCLVCSSYAFLPVSGDGCLAEVPLRLLSNVICPALSRDNLWISSLASPGLVGLCFALRLLSCPAISWDEEQGWCTASSLSLLFPSEALLDAGGRTPPPPPLFPRSVVGLCPSQPTEQNVLVSIRLTTWTLTVLVCPRKILLCWLQYFNRED